MARDVWYDYLNDYIFVYTPDSDIEDGSVGFADLDVGFYPLRVFKSDSLFRHSEYLGTFD